MVKRIASITDMKNRDFQARHLSKAVTLCIKNKLFAPALVLIAAGIDALGDGTKKSYNENLQRYFPELCKALGAHLFWSKYRNGILHEFSTKKGYGIAKNEEAEGEWVATFHVESVDKEIICINIEKVATAFLDWAATLREVARP